MSELTGTKLIRAILQAELDACNAEIAADKLRQQYAEEAKEFHRSEIVEVLREYSDPKWMRATVTAYKFRTNPFGVVYTVSLHRLDGKDGSGGHVSASGANIRKVNDQ